MKLIDDFIIIPGAMGSLLFGIVYGVWTKWGFFRHHFTMTAIGGSIQTVLLLFMVIISVLKPWKQSKQ